MRLPLTDLIFLGTTGSASALHRDSGEIIWKTKLAGSNLVTLLFDFDQLIAMTSGHIFALNAANGEILWENRLSGYGYGHGMLCTVEVPGGTHPAVAVDELEDNQQSSPAGTTSHGCEQQRG